MDAEDAPHGDAALWVEEISKQWTRVGIDENMPKRIHGFYSGQIQGAYLDGKDLWMGVSRPKRLKIIESGLWLVSERRVLVKSIERWVGKLSFAQSFRVCTRSSLRT